MSTNPIPETPVPKPPTPVKAPPTGMKLRSKPGELVVFHHSPLFYWWPVWLSAFLLAAITYFEGHRMVIVPPGTIAAPDRDVEVEDGKVLQKRDVLILPANQKLLTHKVAAGDPEIDQPSVYISHRKGLGTMFLAILLLVITITNVPMRGLWSVFIIVLLVMVSIIFAAAGWWEIIFSRARLLATHINLSGYVLLGTVLLIIWVINFFVLDRQTYIVFTPGQVRVRLEIGGGEMVYDTVGMVVQKQRADLFRHWILGFGSGDLLVRPAGVHHPIEMPNVLQVSWVVKQIEELVKERAVLTSK
jgi:hypothetical protein